MKNLNRLSAIMDKPPGQRNRADRRNASRFAKEEARRIESILTADQLSGAGYPIDRQLRDFLKTCNDERLSGAAEPFSNIWDVYSGFIRPEKSDLVEMIRLKPERDHAFSGTDFFAYATEEALKEQTLPRLRGLPENIIHNFTSLGDLKDISFQSEGRDPVVLSGISLLRQGNQLYWMAVGGPICDLGELTAQRRAMLAEQADIVRARNPHASEAMLRNSLEPTAIPLKGTNDIWLTFTMGLFNLETATHEIRTIGRDWGVTVSVFSDHFEQRYADTYEVDENVRRMVDKAVAEVQEQSLYFDIAETAFSLPAYFATKVSLVTQMDIATRISGDPDAARKKLASKAPLEARPLMRRVSTLDFGPARNGISREYTPPRFRVQVEGFWRRLAADGNGRDAQGLPVKGRTWIAKHARWKDKPPKIGVVLVKSPIGPAIDKAQALVDSKGGTFAIRYTAQ